MVLTESDYQDFAYKKKYVSAKLLTYFAEHPVFIFGYGFNDPNVRSIIEDVGELIADADGFIDNIFYVKWGDSVDTKSSFQDEHVIFSTGSQFRVRAIVTNDFDWLFSELGASQELKSINTKLVRSLAARTYKLIRSDIPRGSIEVNYDALERVVDNEDELPRLLGIVQANNTNLTHPLTLTQVGQRLGGKGWHVAGKLLDRIKSEKGIDIRRSDNRYHCKIKIGRSAETRKWSSSTIDLLRKVDSGEEYTIQL
ncbi:hypothetical protein FEZ63_13240 [Microvirga brassicacearum]|uniref:Uncharacterized protein n=2 Tax=Microvirga brassicacearum TaxID=2580413 RepID=A0A5N3PA52_9HYPH|nr:hypothetical protein FEZ63_13240 [Microvirga brassicacearum]